MKLDTMHELFLDELVDLADAEDQLIKALPKMAEAASTPKLRQAFLKHLEETKVHRERIQSILDRQEKKPRMKACKAMKGLIEEGKERLKADGEPIVIDAGLIAAAQRVEHYEIAAYGCARTYAELLGDESSASLLERTLDEEKKTDMTLNEIAEGLVNSKAASV